MVTILSVIIMSMYSSCQLRNNNWLLSIFLVTFLWKMSAGSNDIESGTDSNILTLSPVLSSIYRSTKSQLHLLQLSEDVTPINNVNNTFVIDALPMPVTGCPDSWTTAHISLSNQPPLYLDVSNTPHLSRSSTDGVIQELHLCVWQSDKHSVTWTHDNYCFIVIVSVFNDDRENICPDNFYRDTLFTDYHTFGWSSRSEMVTLDKCCRSMNLRKPLIPPNFSSPFYLLSAKNDTCTTIEGSLSSTETLKFKETRSQEWKGLQLCYYEEDVSWTLEQKVELAVYVIVLGTPAATLLVVFLCQIRTRNTKRKLGYKQSRMSSNHTQASVMYRHHPTMDHQPSSSSLNERRGCKASTKL